MVANPEPLRRTFEVPSRKNIRTFRNGLYIGPPKRTTLVRTDRAILQYKRSSLLDSKYPKLVYELIFLA